MRNQYEKAFAEVGADFETLRPRDRDGRFVETGRRKLRQRDNNVNNRIRETEHEKALSDKELKTECLAYVQQNFQGKTFVNKATGREIQVSRQGIGEWKMKSKTREQILSAKILDQLLKNATFDHDSNDEKERLDVEKFSYFRSFCEVNRMPFQAIITVKRTKDYGDKYYHHYLEDIKVEPYSGTAPIHSD